MKVIMLKDVGGVGRRGTSVEVSDGYALNSLIPKGQAVQATPARLAELEKEQKRSAATHAAQQKHFEDQAQKINGTTVVVQARANQNGRLFNQVSADTIVEAFRSVHGIKLSTDSIMLNAPIKQTGETEAKIKLGESEATITISVIAAK